MASTEKTPVQGERRRSSVQSIRQNPDTELELPYKGATLTNAAHPFPEAVVSKPVIAARRTVGVFDNDSENSLEGFYQPIDKYEGRHRYDPYFEWEPQEEKKLVRRVSYLYDHIPRLLIVVLVRLEDLYLVLPNVFCAPIRSRQHCPGAFR